MCHVSRVLWDSSEGAFKDGSTHLTLNDAQVKMEPPSPEGVASFRLSLSQTPDSLSLTHARLSLSHARLSLSLSRPTLSLTLFSGGPSSPYGAV
jgi:hypothetical protein